MAKRKKAVKKRKAAKKKKVIKGLWATRETNLLRKLFANMPTAEIAKQLGRGTDAVKRKASRMRLRKSKRYMRSLGRT
jgi:DNA-directed RNA polymerase specialized sigma24 family protein